MGNHAGNKLGYKQEIMDEALDRAKAECVFTERLYEILMTYQERYHIRRKPLKKSEKVGELNLELSRLYNQIWALHLKMDYKGKKKNKQQTEVIA